MHLNNPIEDTEAYITLSGALERLRTGHDRLSQAEINDITTILQDPDMQSTVALAEKNYGAQALEPFKAQMMPPTYVPGAQYTPGPMTQR